MNLASNETSQRNNLRAIWPLLQWSALFLAVVGVRLWMISTYSSSLPIRDQWDYEGATIFKPWLDGTFHVSDLFRPHNEHRMVLARLLGLGLLWINGEWDSRLETVVNTVICGFFVVAAAAAMVRIFEPRSRILLMLGLALWLTLPYCQENTLLALGTSYYSLVFFSLIAIWGMGLHRSLSSQWWTGAVSLILACLDMAAGVFAAMALLGLLGLRLLKRRMKWKEAVPPALLLLAVIGAAIYFRTVVPFHEQLKATSLGNWLQVFARCLAWPFCDAPLVCLLMYLPVMLVAAWYLRAPAHPTSVKQWRQAEGIIVVSVWVALQAAAIAYTRGGSTILLPVSRYMEILAFGAVINLLACTFLVGQMPSGDRRRATMIASIIWAVAMVGGAIALSYQEQSRLGPGQEPILLPYEQSVRGYIATGDHHYLEGSPRPTIPYSDAFRLALLLDDPGIRSILPAAVRIPVPVSVAAGSSTPFVPNGYPPALPNPPYEHTLGSYSDLRENAQGTLRSEAITSKFPYLEFEIAGPPGGAMSLQLQDEATGRRSPFYPRKKADKDWQSGYVAMPGKKVHVVARDDNPAGWFVFREPREVGRFSVYADVLASFGPLLCFIGGILWLTSTAVTDGPGAWRFLTQCSFLRALYDEPGANESRRRLLQYFLFFVACVPVLVAWYFQLKNWINVPIWDEWDTPGIAILHASQHTLTWPDLFAQHNESRKVLPRLICIALALPAGWDVRYAMALTFLSFCAVSALVLIFLRRAFGSLTAEILLAWGVVNFLLFAPTQYENFLSGFAFELLIPVFCLFGTIAINLSQKRFPEKIIWNSILALLATYTFAHGMILWVLAVPIPRPDEWSRKTHRIKLALGYLVYFGVAIATIISYFAGYQRPSVAPNPATLSQVPQVLDFLTVWFGALFRSQAVEPRLAGLILEVVFAFAAVASLEVLLRNRSRWRNYYPWLALGAFSLASGLLTAVGRVNLGVEAVFNPGFDGFSSVKYNATSVFAGVAIIGILANLHRDRLAAASKTLWPMTIGFFAALFCVAWIGELGEERTRVKAFQHNRKSARTAVIWSGALPENPDLVRAYPYPRGFPNRVEEMKRAGLLRIPQVSKKIAEAIRRRPPDGDMQGGNLDRGDAQPDGKFRIAGWARIPSHNTRADYVVLGWEEGELSFHPFAAIPTGSARPEVAELFKAPALRNAGFDYALDVSTLPDQPLTLRAWAVDLAADDVFPLSGSLPFHR
jgi:hypothetical protein